MPGTTQEPSQPVPKRKSRGHAAHHPRPQLFRPSWVPLNGPWNFAFDPSRKWKRPEDVREWTHKIRVPFPPESAMSHIGDTGYHPSCWYRRQVEIPAWEGRIFLHFGAVDYSARVWVNGRFAVSHEGGHTPFSADITALLNPEGPQTIIVWAEDDPLDLEKPRGKQDWKLEPHSIWYPRTSGIWQTVWLEFVPSTFIESIRWTPHLDRYEMGFEAHVAGDWFEGMRISVRLEGGGRVLADDSYAVSSGQVSRSIAFADPGIDDYRNELLWSPKTPTLIKAVVRLHRDTELVDEVRSYTALRSFSVNQGRFMLNGRPFYLRMVLNQGYWPESLMTAPSDEAIRQDIALIKSMGFNGVRLHQKIESPRFLYWADVLGLVVWEEMPSAYRFTDRTIDRLVREWTQVMRRDENHPCVAVWVPFNESWGVPDLEQKIAHQSCVQALYYLTKSMDLSRPVVGNDGWESTATDIVGIHDYESNPARLLERYGPNINVVELLKTSRPGGRILAIEGYPHRGQPLMLTEFGGIAFTGEETPSDAWGYSVSKTPAEFRAAFRALMAVIHQTIFSGFCYTQFADTFQERNGLLDENRKPKIPIRDIARAVRGPRAEHYEVKVSKMMAALPEDETTRKDPI